jgi:LPXTG-site transpeptidase (sortase) family protein
VVSTSLEPLMAGNFSQITITFDEDVYDPPGSSDANDVTNPANYLLVNIGLNNTLDTTSCSAAAGDDSPIAINAVTYDNSTFTATLSINGGASLPIGRYTLFVCGAGQNAIIDPLGNPLNDGADEIIVFEIVRELLPDTGFAPGVQTALVGKSNLKSYSDLWLEVPSLDLEMDILGVPKTSAGWDVSWLGSNAGWLEGSAFPTWSGNTVITGHVWNADGYPGPFINIKSLRHGDTIKLHAWGQVYTYEVRVSRLLWVTQTQVTFQHETYDWLTLLTCENWDSSQGEYRYRRLVRAVLVDISPE